MKKRNIICMLLSTAMLLGTAATTAAERELVNIALNKTVTASDWEGDALPEYACDGINDNEKYTSWKSTGENGAPWIIVDLSLPYKIYSVEVEVRKGNTSDAERKGFEVYGAMSEDFSDSELILEAKDTVAQNGKISQVVKSASSFKYIKVQKTSAEAFSVGELRVMADKENLTSAVDRNSVKVRQPYFSDDRKFFEYEDAAEFSDSGETALLSALGIMQGFEDGNFYPYETVSKAEFAVYVMKLAEAIGLADSAVAEKGYTFADVPADHWANPYIEKAYILGIVSGDENGCASPDKKVTFTEASKMLIAAFGYNNLAKAYGGWPQGYVKLATELGFNKKMAYYGEYITHVDCAKLIYNAMCSDYILISYDDGGISWKKTNNMIMTEIGGIKESTGIVDGAGDISLTNYDPKFAKGYISVNKTAYYTEIADGEEFVGYSVKFWHMFDRNELGDTIVAVAKTSRNKTVEFAKDEYKRAVGYKVYYYGENDKELDLTYRKDADVMYNGRAYISYDPENPFASFTSLKFIDNDGDDVYDCVFITDEQTGVVNFVNTFEKKVYFKNSSVPLKYSSDTIFTAAWDKSAVAAADIKENDVMTVVASGSGEDEIAKIVVARESLYGTVSMITATGGVKIRNKIYEISESYTDADLGIGDTGDFFLDYHGEICYADIKDSLSGTYGYLVGISENELDGFYIRIFAPNGKMMDYYPSENIIIDGKSYSSKDYSRITSRLASTAKKSTYGQPIRYAVKNGLLRLIDTPKEGERTADDIFTECVSNTAIYYSSSRIFDARYPVADDAVVMRVADSVTEYSDYAIELTSKYRDGYHYSFYGYTDNEDEELKLILTYGGYQLERDSGMAVISKVYDSVDDENEHKRAVMAYYNGKIGTYMEEEYGMIDAAGIAEGDIVSMSIDESGMIQGIEKRFYKDELPEGASGHAISAKDHPVQGVDGEPFSIYQDYYMAYATVDKKDGNNIRIQVDDTKGLAKNGGMVLFNATGRNICVYDSTESKAEKRVRAGDVNDLIDEKSGTPSKVVVRAKNGNISFICVIK